ncbi:type III PLP-dependent enzyme [Shimia biformata]|uniref:type III PLP-dependent enzyme n=1 Tax=Shimia biformata TaxID=1294299 RepID=UPI001951362F|nr:type III PLP-dependent enzyme [Shimia biformata]
MQHQPPLWPSSLGYVERFRPDNPVLFFSPRVLQATATRFQRGFPGLVTYAVKANDLPVVLDNLVGAGMSAFDVASPHEMAAMRRVQPSAVLHYHNPVRSRDEVAIAAGYGIQSWSVDCPRELGKLTDVQRTEVSVRLRLPVSGAAYDFGAKFGADPDQAVDLLREAAAMGFTPSITFHPGTQCADPQAWAVYIVEAAEVARRAGVQLARLNVGGGFASHRNGEAPDLEAIFDRIDQETTRAFGAARPELVCEPGRAMVAEAFTLALRVKTVRRDGAVFLNDGVYGALTELRDIGLTDRVRVIGADGSEKGGAMTPRVVFGPTCDSIDRLPDPVPLPNGIEEGDHLLFAGAGAYSAAISTRFNGYGTQEVVTVDQL